jgi:predicted enzyme related to lactoylglutathione lyase
MDMGEGMGTYQMYGMGDVPFGGIFKQPPEMPGAAAWLHYVHVDSVTRVAELVKANGGQLVNGPMEVPGGDMIAQAVDPQGTMFALHSKK